jgi:hypothetical protein
VEGVGGRYTNPHIYFIFMLSIICLQGLDARQAPHSTMSNGPGSSRQQQQQQQHHQQQHHQQQYQPHELHRNGAGPSIEREATGAGPSAVMMVAAPESSVPLQAQQTTSPLKSTSTMQSSGTVEVLTFFLCLSSCQFCLSARVLPVQFEWRVSYRNKQTNKQKPNNKMID